MPWLTYTKLRLTINTDPGPITVELGNFLVSSNAYQRRHAVIEQLREDGAEFDENSSPECRRGTLSIPNDLLKDFPIHGKFTFALTTETGGFDDNARFYVPEITAYS